jgi:oligoribonuclease NrnB/cAMP/cGMP phosphodiesterase (DHH superfamily)
MDEAKCLVLHHNDGDGRASAAVVRRHFDLRGEIGDLKFFEMDYKVPVPFEKVGKGHQVIIVDFSLVPEDMEKLLEITQDVIWIDHHQTAMEYEYSKELEGIRKIDDGSACKLAWEYFFPDEQVPRAIELVSDFDTWTLEDEDSLPFQYGLLSYPSGPDAEIWDVLLGPDPGEAGELIEEMIEDGEAICDYRDQVMDSFRRDNGFETEFEGYKCFALNSGLFGSLAFGPLMDEYDICISFTFDGEQYGVSLYSTKVDVSKIAEKFSGGGHKKASGFSCKSLPFKIKK